MENAAWQALDQDELQRIIAHALREDIGQGDITSQLLIPATLHGSMAFVAREPMTVSGGFIAQLVYQQIDATIKVEQRVEEGAQADSGCVLSFAKGNARTLLAGERVILNLMQRMCGIASLTARYVEAVCGSKAVVLDTRKTMPGLRLLDKYAVRMGGGQNHRMRLDDMVLIKDNHIALCGGVRQAVALARAGTRLAIEVECDTLSQVEEAIDAKPDRIMLDNMTTATMAEAVRLSAGRVKLEASGGVSLDSVRAIAQTGVDYISVGKLTHSATAMDIGADILLDP